jgi:hypothetical protein
LGKDGPRLKRRLDVPLVPVGDLYHLDKLVATLVHSPIKPVGRCPGGDG